MMRVTAGGIPPNKRQVPDSATDGLYLEVQVRFPH